MFIIAGATTAKIVSGIVKFHFTAGSLGIPIQLFVERKNINSYQELTRQSGIGFGRGMIYPYKVLKNITFK